jgi:hypothetical protein
MSFFDAIETSIILIFDNVFRLAFSKTYDSNRLNSVSVERPCHYLSLFIVFKNLLQFVWYCLGRELTLL